MDIYPEDDAVEGGGIIDYFGTWGSYAYFKSGYIFVNTQERGGFLMKMIFLQLKMKILLFIDLRKIFCNVSENIKKGGNLRKYL